jgi:hypothetical protein
MTLAAAREHIGRAVVYDPGHGGALADGTIVRVGEHYVHVRYGHNDTSIQSTPPERLTLLGGHR